MDFTNPRFIYELDFFMRLIESRGWGGIRREGNDWILSTGIVTYNTNGFPLTTEYLRDTVNAHMRELGRTE